jgi:adenylosuccinate lyase
MLFIIKIITPPPIPPPPAVALLTHLARKLPVSRFQRDLTDSTVMRSLGTVFAHVVLSLQGPARGLSRVAPAADVLQRDLEAHWEVLAEPVQTVLRRAGVNGAYESLKAVTRTGAGTGGAAMRGFVADVEGIDDAERARMAEWTPGTYVGNAEAAARGVADKN